MLSCSICWISCNNTSKKDSKATADTLNNMKDSLVDSTRSITKSLHMTVDKADARFAVEAADGGLVEVELGNLAEQNARDRQVKNFGAMMVKDHLEANMKLKDIAKNDGITLPDSLSEYNFKVKSTLISKSGEDFDRSYIEAMLEDHQKDIKLFESAIQTLKDTTLKSFATNTLPILKMHLSAVQTIKNKMK
ncbi:MAG: outer membrane protein-like protein [Mucilaginibacter sp.]|nr:outer membrane protein-like protein [Mucilaginibacter sp.]